MPALPTARPHPVGSDSGLTMVEIIVAMMVFALISVSVAYSLTLALTIGSDNRSREAAANLAAQEIDLSRSIEDVFDLLEVDKTTTMNGTTFHLHRSTEWVTSIGADATCGSGGGQLKYKRVNVSVTWDGMRASTLPVRADTVIAPGSRINDPSLGTILVSVLSSSGTGNAGVTVTATPASPGAAPLTTPPEPTDAQGCSYILKVAPGTYDVAVSSPNSVDVNQKTAPVASVVVTKASASSVSFQYDRSGAYTVKYATNATPGTALLPSNLDTTFKSTYPLFVSTAATNSATRVVALHPFSSGYEIFSGKYVAPSETSPGCVSPDPVAWTTPGPAGELGQPALGAAAPPGGGASRDVTMGLVTVGGLNGKYLKAVSQAYAPGSGAAGCDGTMTYTFGKLTSNSVVLALPYGAWRLYSGTTAGTQTTAVTTNLTAAPPSSVVGGLVTLDPRVAVLP